MESEYSFSSLSLADKKVIAMAIRGYFGSAWKVSLGIRIVHKEKVIESHGASLGLPPEAIKQFQDLCAKKGISLTQAQATQEAHNLINFTRVVNGLSLYLDKKS